MTCINKVLYQDDDEFLSHFPLYVFGNYLSRVNGLSAFFWHYKKNRSPKKYHINSYFYATANNGVFSDPTAEKRLD